MMVPENVPMLMVAVPSGTAAVVPVPTILPVAASYTVTGAPAEKPPSAGVTSAK